jgi:hypothetical protein
MCSGHVFSRFLLNLDTMGIDDIFNVWLSNRDKIQVNLILSLSCLYP